jgi:hypothetical protein
MDLASAAHDCRRGAEQTVSMNTAPSNGSTSKKQGLEINTFLCRIPAENTEDFALIPVYCGFGTFV